LERLFFDDADNENHAMSNPYETDKLLGEYLLFHYGKAEEMLPSQCGVVLQEVLEFPARCVACADLSLLPANARALDVGCAVGRSSFELARHCTEVIGVDFSQRFIDAANAIRRTGELEFKRLEEGARFSKNVAKVSDDIVRSHVSFETGDAMNLRENLGEFDVVLAANLLCRLREPAKFLQRLPQLVTPGGQLILTTPCTWLEEFTPHEHWLCNDRSSTLDGLHRQLDAHFSLRRTLDLPFLIREHARKFQLTIAQASIWIRHEH
jgi:putative 4-mercaptohistidine N1-methyltranferase